MSTDTVRMPGASASAIGIVTALAVIAMTASEPRFGVAVLTSGAGAATIGASMDRSRLLTAALFPAGVLGSLGAVAFAASTGAFGLTLTVIALPLGIAVSTVVFGGGSVDQLREAGSASLYAAIVAGAGTLLLALVAMAGSPTAALTELLYLTGSGAFGLGVAIVVAVIALSAGAIAVPPAAISSPHNRSRVTTARNKVVTAAVVVAVVIAVVLPIVAWLASADSTTAAIVSWVVGSPVVRAVPIVATAIGIVVAFVGTLAYESWSGGPEPPDPVVARVTGAAVGYVAVVPLVVAVNGPLTVDEWTGVLALAAVVFGIGWVFLPPYADWLETGSGPPSRTVLALSLLASGIVAGTGAAHGSAAVTGTNVRGIAALVAIAAGLFVFRAGQFGHALGTEIGVDGSDRRPQLVRLGWIGSVALVGFLIALAGLWVATVFAPTLSPPASAGVLVGIPGLCAGLWLLLNR